MGILTGLHNVMRAHDAFKNAHEYGFDPSKILPMDEYSLSCYESERSVSYKDSDELYFKLDIAGFALSFFALSLVGLLILCDKRIRTHPNEIIAFICLSDAYNYY